MAASENLEFAGLQFQYNGARDSLVRSLLPSVLPSPEQTDHRQDVQAIAELLWESAGRPTGTAEDDWRRAEAIVESAIAATACS